MMILLEEVSSNHFLITQDSPLYTQSMAQGKGGGGKGGGMDFFPAKKQRPFCTMHHLHGILGDRGPLSGRGEVLHLGCLSLENDYTCRFMETRRDQEMLLMQRQHCHISHGAAMLARC